METEGVPAIDHAHPLLRHLLERMIELGASDLYLVAGTTPMCRVEGIVSPVADRVLNPEILHELSRSIMDDRQWERFCRTLEMNLALPIATSERARFRVNVFKQRESHAVVIRRVDVCTPTIDGLGLPPILKNLAAAPRGLVLVVGATGSGKSTTLAAMVNHRNEQMSGHIITIEDPIEYLHTHKRAIVSQREIGFDTRSYRTALKNALRQAPDVLLIGEIRDCATMETALAVADTGHLCLGTLHSTNAIQTFERVINFFPEIRQKEIYLHLSVNLRAIIAQRLVMGTDGRRVAALEILLDTPRIKDLIKKGEINSLREAISQGMPEGCRLFDDDLLNLYAAGRIDLDEALRNADSVNNLRLRIKKQEGKMSWVGEEQDTAEILGDSGSPLKIRDAAA